MIFRCDSTPFDFLIFIGITQYNTNITQALAYDHDKLPEMIIPGHLLIPKIINKIVSAKAQTQPCGIDLSLRRIFEFKSAGTLDFDNSNRETASVLELPIGNSIEKTEEGESSRAGVQSLDIAQKSKAQAKSIFLPPGSYSVEFNETVEVPLDMMGQIFPRSSLFRSGASITTGVVDSGYEGPLGGLLVVSNVHGLRLFQDAKLAQIIFHQMSEKVEGYSGTYQRKEFQK